MSAINEFYENFKFEFTELELDEMERILEIVSNKLLVTKTI
jgi:hypothetical protein